MLLELAEMETVGTEAAALAANTEMATEAKTDAKDWNLIGAYLNWFILYR